MMNVLASHLPLNLSHILNTEMQCCLGQQISECDVLDLIYFCYHVTSAHRSPFPTLAEFYGNHVST